MAYAVPKVLVMVNLIVVKFIAAKRDCVSLDGGTERKSRGFAAPPAELERR